MNEKSYPAALENVGSLDVSPGGRWIAIKHYAAPIVSVVSSERPKGAPAARLSLDPRKLSILSSLAVSWSHRSETLAVSCPDELWVWSPGADRFRQAVRWHFAGKAVLYEGQIKWSPDDRWVLREVRLRKGQFHALYHFECADLSRGLTIPVKDSFKAITIAEWHDDSQLFAVNVIVNQEREEYRTVYVDPSSGEIAAEYS